MGGAASILRRRRGEVVSPTKEKEEAKAEANKPNQEDDAKSLEEIICRLMQVHHAQSKGDRWEKVTKKVNQYLKRRRIPTQSIKDAIRREGVELPTCWQLEEIKERERKLAEALHGKQGSTAVLLAPSSGASPSIDAAAAAAAATATATATAAAATAAAVMTNPASPSEGGDTDSDDEKGEEEQAGPAAAATATITLASPRSAKPAFVPLTKYEIFAMQRRLHRTVGDALLAADEGRAWVADLLHHLAALYPSYPAPVLRLLSQRGRLAAGCFDDALVYGELELAAFARLLYKARVVHGHLASAGGFFYDLGSGAGKLAVAAALAHEFRSSRGIECVGELHEVGKAAALAYAHTVVPTLAPVHPRSPVNLARGDFTSQDAWAAEATVLVVNANLSRAGLAEVRKRADGVRRGGLCLSVSVPAVSPEKWGLLAVDEAATSFGPATVFLHEKSIMQQNVAPPAAEGDRWLRTNSFMD